jgi:hypothetical protein
VCSKQVLAKALSKCFLRDARGYVGICGQQIVLFFWKQLERFSLEAQLLLLLRIPKLRTTTLHRSLVISWRPKFT